MKRPAELTTGYFERHCPEYSPSRMTVAAEWMNSRTDPLASLVDVGCGNGNVLEYLRRATSISDVAGVETSPRLAEMAKNRLGCPVHLGSVLDPSLPEQIGRRFDVVLMGAVLHHLIGPTRRRSMALATAATANVFRLVRPGGDLILFEPVFEPRMPVWALFYLKKAVSVFTQDRVQVLDDWNNIGPPVVSFLSEAEIESMIKRAGGKVVSVHRRDRRLHPLLRACGFRRRSDLTCLARQRT